MPTATSEANTGRPCGLLMACWADEADTSHTTPVTANGKDTPALLDTGSMVILGAGDHLEDPLRRHLPDSAARCPSSVVSRKSIHKPPSTRSPRESPVRRRPWLKRKLGM
ncbi:hypothetical protein AAFF_G00073280 [Aldrovandia affinis]|uniref:Uncharacterized protein n=1 Tax=Aldrovandia affinis TaxID=143900 RepID=A0AAD7WE62_9TELE|nr:hypothetical protein AAFF_G00073280 [Aldrovandia affinis]